MIKVIASVALLAIIFTGCVGTVVAQNDKRSGSNQANCKGEDNNLSKKKTLIEKKGKKANNSSNKK